MRDFCTPANEYANNALPLSYSNIDSLLKKDTLLSHFISQQDILIANATGTLSLIQKMLVSSTDSSIQGQVSYLDNNEQIQQRLLLFRTEIDAVSAELDCEAKRTMQISSYLGNMNKKRNAKLTVGAILAGSVSTIAPVFVTSKIPQNVVLISSGTIAAGLGLLTLNAGGKKVRLVHYRNLLRDIWFTPKSSTIYPPGIWYILNESKLNNAEQISKTQMIKMRWLKFELNNSADSDMENLLFKDGGIYNQDNLDLRVTMLNELQSVIRSINQYLQNFIFDLNNITRKVQIH